MATTLEISRRGAFSANLATICLAVVAAMIAVPLVSRNPWLRQKRSKNVPRLAIFLLFLLCVIFTGAAQIGIIAHHLLSPLRYYDGYRDSDDMLRLSFAAAHFGLVSDACIFLTIFIEIQRGSGISGQPPTLLEVAYYAMIGCLFIIAPFGMDANTALAGIGYSNSQSVLGVRMTYAVVAFLFATSMVINTLSFPSREPASFCRRRCLLILAGIFWFYELLILVTTTLVEFLVYARSHLVSSLSAISHLCQVAIIVLVVLIARDCSQTVLGRSNIPEDTTSATQSRMEGVERAKYDNPSATAHMMQASDLDVLHQSSELTTLVHPTPIPDEIR